MITVPCILCYVGCQRGDYTCTYEKFPWVSDTMGLFPNDKIYIFIMNFFTAVQFFTFRGYYQKLSTYLSPCVNNTILSFAYVTLVAGPILALFDHYGNDDKDDPNREWRHSFHMTGAKLFTLGHIIYTFTLIHVFSSNKDKFAPF